MMVDAEILYDLEIVRYMVVFTNPISHTSHERLELLIVCFTMEAGMLGMSSIQYSNYVILMAVFMSNCCIELQVDHVLNGTRLLQANTMERVVLNVWMQCV